MLSMRRAYQRQLPPQHIPLYRADRLQIGIHNLRIINPGQWFSTNGFRNHARRRHCALRPQAWPWRLNGWYNTTAARRSAGDKYALRELSANPSASHRRNAFYLHRYVQPRPSAGLSQLLCIFLPKVCETGWTMLNSLRPRRHHGMPRARYAAKVFVNAPDRGGHFTRIHLLQRRKDQWALRSAQNRIRLQNRG